MITYFDFYLHQIFVSINSFSALLFLKVVSAYTAHHFLLLPPDRFNMANISWISILQFRTCEESNRRTVEMHSKISKQFLLLLIYWIVLVAGSLRNFVEPTNVSLAA